VRPLGDQPSTASRISFSRSRSVRFARRGDSGETARLAAVAKRHPIFLTARALAFRPAAEMVLAVIDAVVAATLTPARTAELRSALRQLLDLELSDESTAMRRSPLTSE
jgi:hypothetical protein